MTSNYAIELGKMTQELIDLKWKRDKTKVTLRDTIKDIKQLQGDIKRWKEIHKDK